MAFHWAPAARAARRSPQPTGSRKATWTMASRAGPSGSSSLTSSPWQVSSTSPVGGFADRWFQRRAQLRYRLKPFLDGLLDALHHQRVELRSDRRVVMANRVFMEAKWRPQPRILLGEQMVHDLAQGKDVRAAFRPLFVHPRRGVA